MTPKTIVSSCIVIMFCLTVVFVGFGLITGCTDKDDDNDVDQPSTATPTATNTPTQTDGTPTPTQTPAATPTPKPETATVYIWTTPVYGDIYLNYQWIGFGEWVGELEPSDYIISFGDVPGYTTPENVWIIVSAGETYYVEGDYSSGESCSFSEVFVNQSPYEGDVVYTWFEMPNIIQFNLLDATSWTATALYGYVTPDTGPGGNNMITYYALEMGPDTLTITGSGAEGMGDCVLNIYFYVDNGPAKK